MPNGESRPVLAPPLQVPHPRYQSIKVAPLPPIPLWDGLESCHGRVMFVLGGFWSGHSAGWITLR